MKITKDMLLAGFVVSLLITVVSGFLYVTAWLEVGSAPQERVDGCGTKVLVHENDRYVTVCPEDSLKGKVSAFLAPKAAVASIIFIALFFYQSSKNKLRE